MNVYFCDVCGVRVTDVDLHSGHGIRRRHDVICAACLDLGHGKEWINNGGTATSGASANAGAAVAAAPARTKAPAPAPVVPAIKRARDDLATIDEDADKPAAAVAAAPPELEDADALLKADEDADARRTPEPPALAPAPIFDEEDEGGIPGASAPAAAAPAAEVPPMDDDSGGISALTGADEALDGVPVAPKGAETEPGAPNPFADDDVPAKPAASAADVAAGRAPAERPAKKDSSHQAKAGKSPSGKSARISGKAKSSKKSMSPVVLISMVSIICLVVCFGVALSTGMLGGGGSRPGTVVDPNNNLKDLTNAVAAVRSSYSKAMNSQKLPDVTDALSKMDDLRTTMKSTEEVLKGMKPPWTDEQIGTCFEARGVNDALGLRKALSDLKVKLQENP